MCFEFFSWSSTWISQHCLVVLSMRFHQSAVILYVLICVHGHEINIFQLKSPKKSAFVGWRGLWWKVEVIHVPDIHVICFVSLSCQMIDELTPSCCPSICLFTIHQNYYSFYSIDQIIVRHSDRKTDLYSNYVQGQSQDHKITGNNMSVVVCQWNEHDCYFFLKQLDNIRNTLVRFSIPFCHTVKHNTDVIALVQGSSWTSNL